MDLNVDAEYPAFGQGDYSPGGVDACFNRVYAWETGEDEEIAQMKAEVDEQERLIEEHQRHVSGSEAYLETMIKDLRAELQGFRDENWKLEQFEELSDMKFQLMLGTSVGDESEDNNHASADHINFDELDALNSEMDEEMSMLMSQLGLVKGEMQALDERRKKLMDELDAFDEDADPSYELDILNKAQEGCMLESPCASSASGIGHEGIAQDAITKLDAVLNNVGP